MADYQLSLNEALISALTQRALRITAAESCTGGMFASALTDVAGSSACFEQGFVCYSNRAKQCQLNVAVELLRRYGAVSEAVVEAMLGGALSLSGADLGVAISGVAGPGGGSEEKPVGTVCFAWGSLTKHQSITCHFNGGRADVRRQARDYALSQCIQWLKENSA